MEIIVYLIIMGLVSIYNAWKKKQQPQSKGPKQRAPRPQQPGPAQQSRPADAEAPAKPPEIQIPDFLRDLLEIPDPEPAPSPPPPKPRETPEYARPDMPAGQFHDHAEEGTLHDWIGVHPQGPPIKKKRRKPKKKTPLAEMLSSKRSLRKSIIIKEILDKPVSMRPRSPIGHR